MAISGSQGKTKSHKQKFFQSRYLAEFLTQGPKILYVIITFIGFKITFSNMGPKATPSLISKGGYQMPPPLGGREIDIDTPWEIGLRSLESKISTKKTANSAEAKRLYFLVLTHYICNKYIEIIKILLLHINMSLRERRWLLRPLHPLNIEKSLI